MSDGKCEELFNIWVEKCLFLGDFLLSFYRLCSFLADVGLVIGVKSFKSAAQSKIGCEK